MTTFDPDKMYQGPSFPPFDNTLVRRREMSEVLGTGIKVYTTTKMGVLAYQAHQRARDAGATQQEAIVAGATAAGAWMAFFMLSLFYPAYFGAVAFTVVKYYDPIRDEMSVQSISEQHLWTAVIGIGVPTLIFLSLAWLVLYSRLKNTIASKRAGWWYRRGFALDRGWFRNRSSTGLWVMAIIALWPFNLALTDLNNIF